jgi:hypothetical protein
MQQPPRLLGPSTLALAAPGRGPVKVSRGAETRVYGELLA